MVRIFSNQKGFTLLETMVVVVIISIVASLAIPQLLKIKPSVKVNEMTLSLIGIINTARSYAVKSGRNTQLLFKTPMDYTPSNIMSGNIVTPSSPQKFLISEYRDIAEFGIPLCPKTNDNNPDNDVACHNLETFEIPNDLSSAVIALNNFDECNDPFDASGLIDCIEFNPQGLRSSPRPSFQGMSSIWIGSRSSNRYHKILILPMTGIACVDDDNDNLCN